MKENKITRREFLKAAGYGSLAALGTGMLPSETLAAIEQMQPMKITKVEAITPPREGGRRSSWTWVRLTTDNGITGIGETYPYGNAQLGAVRDQTRRLIGRDPRDIEAIWREIFHALSMRGQGGSDMHILDAINTAQWDILGKACGLPVYYLLGGKSKVKLKVYESVFENGTLNGMNMDTNTEGITRFLLDRGINAIKIYPFNRTATRNNYDYISANEVEKDLDYIKRIRATAGNEMDILLDFGGRWNLPSAMRIAKALEPYNIYYIEDIMEPDNVNAYSILARETSIPICVSETFSTRFRFRDFLEEKAVDIVMFDLCWCGGISEAKKIADMADTYYLPVVPHTRGGPILWFASIQVSAALTNFSMMESGYHQYTELYPYYISNVPTPVDGFVTAPDLPGLGIEFRPETFTNAVVETIAEI